MFKKKISRILFGRNTDFLKMKLNFLEKNITIHSDEQHYKFSFDDGIFIDLYKKIKKLESEIEQLKTKKSK